MTEMPPIQPPANSPAQPPYPPYVQQQPPRKSFVARHKVLSTLVVIAAVIVGISVANSGGGDSDASAQSAPGASSKQAAAKKQAAATAPKKAPAKTTPGIGDKVRDGKFEFTVTKVTTGVKSVGDDMLGEKAQGQFVVVHMVVENIGNDARTFDASSQELTDDKGRHADADAEASIYLDDSNSFLEDINPGNSVKGVVIFDIAKTAKPASIELHDSMFSGGALVSLTH